MSYAIKKDGTGWRAVNSESDCAANETFSVTQPTPIMASVEQTLVSLSQYQFRMCLINNNMLDQIITAITNIADPTQKAKVETAFNYAQYFSRTDELVSYMASTLNLTSDQVDTLWQQALTL